MKTKLLVLFLSAALVLNACGKKDETTTTQKQDTVKQTQQTEQQIQQQNDVKKQQEQKLADDKKAEDDKKKDDDKKNDEDKKKKEDDKKKEDVKKEDTKTETSGVDFSQVWPKKCVKCHGTNGKGKVEGVPDITKSETKKKSESELKKIISSGVKGKTEDDEDMPAWKGKLTDEEIDAAVKYVKKL
jgi:cytochrome c553